MGGRGQPFIKMKKTYQTPSLLIAEHIPACIFAVSDVNSNIGIGGGGGADGSVVQRARQYDAWAQTQWATPTEE